MRAREKGGFTATDAEDFYDPAVFSNSNNVYNFSGTPAAFKKNLEVFYDFSSQSQYHLPCHQTAHPNV